MPSLNKKGGNKCAGVWLDGNSRYYDNFVSIFFLFSAIAFEEEVNVCSPVFQPVPSCLLCHHLQIPQTLVSSVPSPFGAEVL